MKRANQLDVVPLLGVRYDDTTKLEDWHAGTAQNFVEKESGAHIIPMEVISSRRRVEHKDSV